jgi:hypothetical protein
MASDSCHSRATTLGATASPKRERQIPQTAYRVY